MKKVSLALASLLAATGLSACGAEPTSPRSPVGVSSSENRPLRSTSDSDATSLISSTTAGDTTDTSGRNGLGLGSGN
jgi:ABC-type glycerol-3-phosphate transport system substrate-binding protein